MIENRKVAARWALAAAPALLLSPALLLPLGLLDYRNNVPGFSLLFAWTALCVAAVLADRMLIWAALCLTPLAIASYDWLRGPPAEDPFGFYPIVPLLMFSSAAIVTAATGTLSVVLTAIESRCPGSR